MSTNSILKIYQKYQIMPNLQEHQLRVAGVAKIVCEAFTTSIDTNAIVCACLLHDMGNIIKFDLKKFPQFLEPNGLTFWEMVQTSFKTKYGINEYQASLTIAKEVGASKKVLDLVAAIGFSETQKNYDQDNLEAMICEYADDRVAPNGVVSLEERIEDLRVRYEQKHAHDPEYQQKRETFAKFARLIEKKLASHMRIKPDAITQRTVDKVLPELQDWVI